MASRTTQTGGRAATTGIIPGRWALSVGNPGTAAAPGFAWRRLTDLARLESGHTPSRRSPEYWDGDVPWVGIKDATGNHGRTISSTLQWISEAGLENSSARLLPAGTVCLSRTASVGYVVTMGVPMATSQDFINWVCGPELSSRYLHYLLLSEQEAIRRFAHGTTHQTVYFPEAKAFHVCVPDRAEQDRIGAMLGALDEKIAVNERIAATALELADVTFLWAVSGVEPGEATFGSVAGVGGGGTPSTKVESYWGGDIAWTTPSDVTALLSPYLFDTGRSITSDGLDSCASPLYSTKSIFMTSRATIGVFALPQIPAAVNQGFIVVTPPDDSMRWWLFHEMRSRVPEMVSLCNGSTFLELSRKNFKAMQVRLPAAEVIEEFAMVAAPLHESAAHAAEESRSLATLRDTLLPQLMSGRIRVKDAEKIVEDHV
ncbi:MULTISPECIES: restriction endonuclease subunit S [unclassified Streptomyces]|uniref:restriction endonuclease subunit S n=1 Tax=unclassified Streptomyces TaxID=2593676 RepID=UPI0033BE61C9